MSTPLWLKIRNHPSLFCLHPTTGQLAILLRLVAEEGEHRGEKGLDLDPGETSDWLISEAEKAEAAK